ncbi:MAG: sugar phosphate nucleotidyltransferase [Pseudomonadota bacterium]
MGKITPVIMAGGSGTRLWPLSRGAQPKQYQALVGSRTMLEETLARVSGDDYAAPVVIGSTRHREVIEAQLPSPEARIVLEPFGRNTGPAAIVAALLVGADDPDALVLLLPADHHIADRQAFSDAVGRGVAAAETGHLVTLGITAESPETGYGYIKRGTPLTEGTFKVEAFVEKPDRPTAEQYIAESTYAWNAGIFLYRASDLLREAEQHAGEMLAKTKIAFAKAEREGRSLALMADDFNSVPSDSIDYALMEKTENAAVVNPVTIGWDDIGSWAAVKAFSDGESSSDVIAIDCQDTMIRTGSDGPLVAAVGLEGFVVVATGDTVLICPQGRCQDVKKIVEELKARNRNELL